MKWRATAATWFSTFPLNALVQPRVAPEVHSHGQVLPLHVAGADVVGVRRAHNLVPLNAGADGGLVPTLILCQVRPIRLDDLRVVHLAAEGSRHEPENVSLF